MDNYFQIKNHVDIDTFIKKTNALHDGFIIAVEYHNNGIEIADKDYYEFNSELTQLKIRVLITSIQDAVLEMVFENILEWKITEAQHDILEADVCFVDKDFIVWSDDAVDMNHIRANHSYVIAKMMKWRIV